MIIVLVICILPVLADSGVVVGTVIVVNATCDSNKTSCGIYPNCTDLTTLDGLYGDLYCSDGNVVQIYREYYCTGTTYDYNISEQIQQNCTYGCVDETCKSYTGGGINVNDIIDFELTPREIKYPSNIFPSSPEETVTIIFPSFMINNIGKDSYFQITYSCYNDDNCMNGWCGASDNNFQILQGDSKAINLICTIPENIKYSEQYTLKVLVTNGADRQKSLQATLITADEKTILQVLASRERNEKIKNTVYIVGGFIGLVILLWWISKIP